MKKNLFHDLKSSIMGPALAGLALFCLILGIPGISAAKVGGKIYVVATLTDYAAIAREIAVAKAPACFRLWRMNDDFVG